MKTVEVEVLGKVYPAMVRLRVMSAIEEREGKTFNKAIVELMRNAKTKDLIWLMRQLMVAGVTYVRQEGETIDDPPTEDEMLDLMDADGLLKLTDSLTAALTTGQGSIEVRPPKNAEAAQVEES